MKNKKNVRSAPRLPKVALNVVREDAPGEFQVYQIYAGMSIPLLGRFIAGSFEPQPARTRHEAFDRLNNRYYLPKN